MSEMSAEDKHIQKIVDEATSGIKKELIEMQKELSIKTVEIERITAILEEITIILKRQTNF